MCKGIQRHPHGIFWNNNIDMFTVLFFNGLCTSNMFMVLQVVVLWLYIYELQLNFVLLKIYLSTKIYFIGGWGGRGLTSTLCTCILLLEVKCCVLVDDYHISKTQVELPTFLFNGNYRSPILLFNINIIVNFQLFIIL